MISRRKFLIGGIGAILAARKMPALITRSSIGGHNIIRSTSDDGAEYTAQDYVQDGLISIWDGIENVDWGIHDNNSSTWINLVGGRDMTLSNSYFNRDSLCRDSYGQGFLAYNDSGRLNYDVMSFEFCVDLTYQDWSVPLTIGWRKEWGNGLGIKDRNDSRYGIYIHGVSGAKTYRRPYATGNMRGTVGCSDEAFFNGELLEEDSSLLAATAANWDNRGVCAGGNSIYNTKGKIYCLRIYDRLLSYEEIKHNNMIDKERFGL